jgi:hypothetical protein
MPACAFEHLVHVYESTGTLVRCVVSFLAPAFDEGAAVVVATPGHHELFRRGLLEAGLDVDALTRTGRFVARDAEETLATFFHDGDVDVDRFDSGVGALVSELSIRHGRVHVYGEMVACLWGRGDGAAALDLEEAWNDLGRRADFRLCCAYAAADLDRGLSADVDSMLRTHSASV